VRSVRRLLGVAAVAFCVELLPPLRRWVERIASGVAILVIRKGETHPEENF